MPITDTAINKYLNYEFRNTTITNQPSTFYVDLSTTAINTDGSGSTAITGGGYTSASLVRNTANWTESVTGEVANAVMVSFPSGSGVSTEDWGTIMAVIIRSDTSGSMPVYFSNLSPYIEAPVATRIMFSGGSLKFGRRNQTGE